MTDHQTRDRILASAAELFAEHGFQGTTVRQICKAARANSAGIHYHFGDKGGLYEAVLMYAIEQKPEVAYPPGAAGEERIHLWVEAMARSCLGEPPTLISRLMSLELKEPTEYIALIIKHMITPKMAELQAAITEVLGQEIPTECVQRLALSIVGQLMIYDHSRAVIDLLFPHFDRSEPCLTALIDHVSLASLGMLEKFKEKKNV